MPTELRKLDILLTQNYETLADVEFMTSMELGDVMTWRKE